MMLVCISLMTNDVWGTNHGLYAESILVIEKSIFQYCKGFGFFFFLVFFWLCPMSCGILVSRRGIKPAAPALEAQS